MTYVGKNKPSSTPYYHIYTFRANLVLQLREGLLPTPGNHHPTPPAAVTTSKSSCVEPRREKEETVQTPVWHQNTFPEPGQNLTPKMTQVLAATVCTWVVPPAVPTAVPYTCPYTQSRGEGHTVFSCKDLLQPTAHTAVHRHDQPSTFRKQSSHSKNPHESTF